MEGIMFPSSPDHQPLSPYKSHMKTNAKRGTINRPPSIARQNSENFVPLNYMHINTGLLQAPFLPPYHLSLSYPPFPSQQLPQPPLLPLPIISTITKPHNTNKITNSLTRGLSCPPTNRKTNNNNIRTRGSSLTPKKTKTISKKDVNNLKPLGPEPKDLPEKVSKTLSLLSVDNTIVNTSDVSSLKDQVGEFSGPVIFAISPPPSSLPLPTFSLRPKLSCNA